MHLASLLLLRQDTAALEREFLGILFALNHFRKLLTGIKCEVHTDHKTSFWHCLISTLTSFQSAFKSG